MFDSTSSRMDFSEVFDLDHSEVEARADYRAPRVSETGVARSALTPQDLTLSRISEALQAAFAAGLKAGASASPNRAKPRRDQPKYMVIAELLTREQGCMAWEIREATGWTTFSIPRWAEAAGLRLHKERICGNTFRFFGVPHAVAERMEYEVVGPPRSMRIVFWPKGTRPPQAASAMAG